MCVSIYVVYKLQPHTKTNIHEKYLLISDSRIHNFWANSTFKLKILYVGKEIIAELIYTESTTLL